MFFYPFPIRDVTNSNISSVMTWRRLPPLNMNLTFNFHGNVMISVTTWFWHLFCHSVFKNLKISFRASNLSTRSKIGGLHFVGIWIKSVYKIVLTHLFKTDILVYNFHGPSSKWSVTIFQRPSSKDYLHFHFKILSSFSWNNSSW